MGPVKFRFRPPGAKVVQTENVGGQSIVDEVVREGGGAQVVEIEHHASQPPKGVAHVLSTRMTAARFAALLPGEVPHGANQSDRADTLEPIVRPEITIGQAVRARSEYCEQQAPMLPSLSEILQKADGVPARRRQILVPEALEEVPSKYPKSKRSKRHGRRP